jgi:hypothetical protein
LAESTLEYCEPEGDTTAQRLNTKKKIKKILSTFFLNLEISSLALVYDGSYNLSSTKRFLGIKFTILVSVTGFIGQNEL